MDIEDLVVEVTRRCNMSCDHCLRGEPEAIDLNILHLRELLYQTSTVSSLTLTGGDPSLVPEIIRAVVSEFESRNMSLDHFYMVTNGKKVTDEFICSVIKLYMYCDNKEGCQLDLSNDGHHEEIEPDNIDKLSALKFFGKKSREDGIRFDTGKTTSILYEGRARTNNLYGFSARLNGFNIEMDGEIIDRIDNASVYLNAKGDILGACDLSFKTQEHLACGNVTDEGFSLEKSAQRWNKLISSAEVADVEHVLEHMGVELYD